MSSKEQEDSGYSLPAQQKLLSEYANRKDYNVKQIFAVAESASGAKQRKVFAEMMFYVKKNKVKIILCEKVDRITRNFKEAVVLNNWIEDDEERQIHFVKQNLIIHKNAKSDEKFRWDIEIVLAKKYIANLSEEVKKGQKEKITQGWLPQKPPPGYISTGGKGHKIHIINKPIAPHIRKMFELYGTGNYSIIRLEDELYKQGWRSSNGNKILQSRIHELLQDPFYCGMMRWNNEIFPGKHEPLISKELFNRVQGIMKNRGRIPVFTKHNYLFASRIFCEGCGGVLSWETQKGILYGHCNNHLKSRYCSKKTYIKEKDVEKQITPIFSKIAPKNEAVLKWIEEIIIEENANQVQFRETEIHRLNALLLKVRKDKDRYFEATINRVVDLEYCERKIKECKKEEDLIEKALENVQTHSDDFQELRLLVHKLAFNALEIYENALIVEKRLLFAQLFTNFTQNAYEIKPKYNLACKYLIEWIPKLNKAYELEKPLLNKVESTNSIKYKSLLAWKDSLRMPIWQEMFPDPIRSIQDINHLLHLPAIIC